jgi:hypothetical protein
VLLDTGPGANFVASALLGHLGLQPDSTDMPQIGLFNGLRVKPLGICVIHDAYFSVYTSENIPFVPCSLLFSLQFKRSLKQSEAVCLVMVTPEKSCD